jgi:uncharacterized protein YozE (UPF0346 family)
MSDNMNKNNEYEITILNRLESTEKSDYKEKMSIFEDIYEELQKLVK